LNSGRDYRLLGRERSPPIPDLGPVLESSDAYFQRLVFWSALLFLALGLAWLQVGMRPDVHAFIAFLANLALQIRAGHLNVLVLGDAKFQRLIQDDGGVDKSLLVPKLARHLGFALRASNRILQHVADTERLDGNLLLTEIAVGGRKNRNLGGDIHDAGFWGFDDRAVRFFDANVVDLDLLAIGAV